MRIGVFSQHPDRLLWYASFFPEHSFFHIVPESDGPGVSGCDYYIVDADLLTDDPESYGDLTRYFNRGVIETLGERRYSLCLITPFNRRCELLPPENTHDPGFATAMTKSSPNYLHTVFHQEKQGS